MKVSIYCMVYNHERYLKDTLEGFVNQKVDFNYEVWVHDDASTDGSEAIIKEYAEKYPHIIKPIIQKENQYSKGVSIFKKYIYPKMTGKYIAVCEGDDYWCDNDKLQKQVDFLDNHSDYIACVHNTEQINIFENKKRIMYSKQNKDLELLDVIQGGSSCFHTSSLMYRYEYGRKDAEFLKTMNWAGDYSMAIYLSLNGKIRYLKDVMSVYRFGSINSWTRKINTDINKLIQYKTDEIKFLIEVEKYAQGKNKDIVYDKILDAEYKLDELCGGTERFKKEELKRIYKKKNLVGKIKSRLMYYLNREYVWLRQYYFRRNI